jgi:hypothetical protein
MISLIGAARLTPVPQAELAHRDAVAGFNVIFRYSMVSSMSRFEAKRAGAQDFSKPARK